MCKAYEPFDEQDGYTIGVMALVTISRTLSTLTPSEPRKCQASRLRTPYTSPNHHRLIGKNLLTQTMLPNFMNYQGHIQKNSCGLVHGRQGIKTYR
ncbi:hypothetical protein JG688_00013057 [Phytophthora aleatoria]|uniref:Uncharacterized protein n=1 Tax=Phytophthora aleatoria TaxID=2496075 RepID=A0A8J5M1I7_9STRA|nr:hypothetical protein JG688_00013057 [Phytophthora aleatoria]